ncbi:hypothetical protein [Streptomyces sp. NPDC097610]|uniref:hypothetical protein n=1 Tax=Streptomyces sp. NPDC097610 TaxID=3157227 RepID=UPI0033213EC6
MPPGAAPLAAEAAWLVLTGLAVERTMLLTAATQRRPYLVVQPQSMLGWMMVLGGALVLYSVLLMTGLIPQADSPLVRIVMQPLWLAGVVLAVRRGRLSQQRAWADRMLTGFLSPLMTQLTALHRRTAGADDRAALLVQAREALRRGRGRDALKALDELLAAMAPDQRSREEWSELRRRTTHMRAVFGIGPTNDDTTSEHPSHDGLGTGKGGEG